MTLRAVVLALLLALPLAAVAAPRTLEEARAVDAAFVAGLAALDAGRPAPAIATFRAILARHPDLVRVRLELGRAYFADRQWANARQEFLLALSADLPDPVRANVLRFIREIDARRGFDWSLDIAVAELRSGQDYATDRIDLNFGGAVLPFTLERPDLRETGLTFSGGASLRADLPGLSRPTFSTGAFGEVFASGDLAREEALRDVTAGVRAGLRFAAVRTTSSAALVVSRRDVATQHFEDRVGLSVAAERRTATGLSVFAAASANAVDNAERDTLDGELFAASLGLAQSLGGRARIGVMVFGERLATDTGFEAYDRAGLTVFGSIEAGFGLSIRPDLTLARKRYPDPNPLFADSPDERDLRARVRIEKTDLILGNGFSPFLEMEARIVESGIEAFSYTSRDLRVGLRRVF